MAELNYAASKDALVNAQEGFQQVLAVKDPKQVTEILSADSLQAVNNQAVAYQRKVTKVLRDGGKELATVVDSSVNELQDSFQDWINTLAANAPAGSDAFVSALKTTYGSALQGFEQFRAVSKEAFATAEKTADQAIDAVQGQIAQVKKATSVTRGTRKSV